MKRVVLPSPDPETARRPEPSAIEQSSAQSQAPQTELTKKNAGFSPEVKDILLSSLKTGGTVGACGLFVGAAAGIIRSAPPVFFSLISGVQWFTLGTSFTAARAVTLTQLAHDEDCSPRDKVIASSIGGGVAGTLGGMLRGPRNILPGALVFTMLGAGGQVVDNWRIARRAKSPPSSEKGGFWSKWSPITWLSDQEYEKILEERILRIDADIALIDDRIKELRESEKKEKENAGASTPTEAQSK